MTGTKDKRLWEALNVHHPSITLCHKGVEWKWFRLSTEESRSGSESTFQAYGQNLTDVKSFKYLGQSLKSTDDY